MDRDNLVSEARARIIWGDSASDVRYFLISSGLPESDANARIREFSLERNQEVRKCSIRRILVGAALVLPGAFEVYLLLGKAPIHGSLVGHGRAMGFAFALALYGLWKMTNGIIGIIRPQSEHDSIADMK